MRFSFLLFFILFIACNKSNIPADILPQHKMEAVLWDLIRADEYVFSFVLKDSAKNKKQESIKLYEQVFRIHKINKKSFQKSFSFYEDHPELLQPLMDTLESRKKRETEKIRSYPFRTNDSIQVLKKGVQ